MTKIIGITGLIASGKTTVSSYFKENNYKVFDADFEVRKLYNDILFLKKIKKFFPNVFIKDTLNKSLLSKIVFEDKKRLTILENLIHPIVKNRCNNFIKKNQNQGVIFIDIPLLFENGWDKKCDEVILIITSKENQIKRYLNRDSGNEKNIETFKNILKNQGDIKYKIKLSNFVLENDGSIEDLHEKLKQYIKKYKTDNSLL